MVELCRDNTVPNKRLSETEKREIISKKNGPKKESENEFTFYLRPNRELYEKFEKISITQRKDEWFSTNTLEEWNQGG